MNILENAARITMGAVILAAASICWLAYCSYRKLKQVIGTKQIDELKPENFQEFRQQFWNNYDEVKK